MSKNARDYILHYLPLQCLEGECKEQTITRPHLLVLPEGERFFKPCEVVLSQQFRNLQRMRVIVEPAVSICHESDVWTKLLSSQRDKLFGAALLDVYIATLCAEKIAAANSR